jgi:hypothetical protein
MLRVHVLEHGPCFERHALVVVANDVLPCRALRDPFSWRFVNMTRFLSFSGLLVLLECAASCGGNTSHRRVAGNDAGPDVGPQVAAGGSSAASGGSGGTSSGGASNSGGTTATGGTAPIDASVDHSVPAPPEAGPAPCAAALDGALEWRDFAAGVCKSCPAATPHCSDLLAAPGPSYDATTRVLTLHVTPGTTQIVSAGFTFDYEYALQDGGTGRGHGTLSAKIDENTLQWDLSKVAPASTFNVENGAFMLTDACGTTSTDNAYALEISVVTVGVAKETNVICGGR